MTREIKYYIYAKVNDVSTDKFECEDFSELYEIFHNQLSNDIEEELLYQSLDNMEEL